MTIGSTQCRPAGLRRLWASLTRCEMDGCGERPVHLGWCAHHAPEYNPAPDEYWGDQDGSDQR
jgi:hypothetical protein